VTAPAEIIELVKRFELHRESYQSAGYNETQLRREFVDPFFQALGWDVDNERGYAEAQLIVFCTLPSSRFALSPDAAGFSVLTSDFER
jgi:hypothetical protein